MTTTSITTRMTFSPRALALVLGMTMLLAACDSNNAIESTTDGTGGAFAAESALGFLTNEEIAIVASDLGVSMNQDGTMRDPGALWALAAELHKTMTQEQRARLLERLEQMAANRRAGGERGMRPGRPGQGGFHTGPNGQRDNLLAELNLTAEQEAALAAIREDFRAQSETLRGQFHAQDQGQDRVAYQEAVRALREELHAAVIGVLTADQAAQLEELRTAAEAEREARQAERRQEREARRMATEAARAEALNLTAEQLAALEELEAAREAFREEVRALRDAGASAEEIRAAIDAHQQAHPEGIAQILTQEQLEITAIHRVLTLRMAARRSQAGQGGMQGRPGPGGQGPRGFGGQN